MASLVVTVKGQVTLNRDLLRHLGIKPGDRVEFEKRPGGELRVRAAQRIGSIDDFFNVLGTKETMPLSIDEMNEAASAGRAGRPEIE